MQEPRTISGKALIEKLGIDEYEIWQEMKQGLRPHGGSFSTQVEVARLLVAEDIPDDLSIIQKLQFSTEDVQIFIKAKGPPKKKHAITGLPGRPHYPPGTPDWAYWKNRNSWKIVEAVCLIHNYDPEKLENKNHPIYDKYNSPDDPKAQELRATCDAAITAVKLKRLAAVAPSDPSRADLYTDVNPGKFITWAKKRGFNVPDALKGFAHRMILDGREVDADHPVLKRIEEKEVQEFKKNPPQKETSQTPSDSELLDNPDLWMTYRELKEHWGNRTDEDFILLMNEIGLQAFKGKYPPLSCNPEAAKLKDCYFLRFHVAQKERDYPKRIVGKQKQGLDGVAEEAQNQEPDSIKQDSEAPQDDYALCKKGQFWELKFKGKAHMLKDTKGIQYIAKLLILDPGTECHVTDLIPKECSRLLKDGDTLEKMDGMTDDQLSEEGVSIDNNDYDRPQRDEIMRLKDMIQIAHDKLVKAKKEGDQNEIKRAEDSFEESKKIILNEYGLRTTVKRQTVSLKCLIRQKSDIKKLKDAVSVAIKRAMDKIKKECDYKLYEFLKDSIHINGTTCSYNTKREQTPRWTVKL